MRLLALAVEEVVDPDMRLVSMPLAEAEEEVVLLQTVFTMLLTCHQL